jgi:hypothetical protein
MPDIVDQLDSAEWTQIPAKYAVGIPLAVGTIIFLTAAGGTALHHKARDLKAQKARREMHERNRIRAIQQ